MTDERIDYDSQENESWFHGKNIQKPEKKEQVPAGPSEESVRLDRLIQTLQEKIKSRKKEGGDSNG